MYFINGANQLVIQGVATLMLMPAIPLSENKY
jgi:hypothetical protein